MDDDRPGAPTEADLPDTAAGRRPGGAGWFVLNAADATWTETPGYGRWTTFEPAAPDRFRDFGINIHVLEPGETSTRYHGEDAQEDFLVLAGTPLLIVEGQERTLRPWDLVHCPPWTRHAFVGAGDGPSAILMVGARETAAAVDRCQYVPDPAAARHGAAPSSTTWSPDEAYAGRADGVDAPYRDGSLPRCSGR